MSAVDEHIAEVLPHLKRYARHLARNGAEADDLVQDCVERALTKSHLFQPGTSLRAWCFTLMRNIFVNGKRRQVLMDRHADRMMNGPARVQEPTQFHAMMLSRAWTALDRLSEDEREAVLLLGLDQRSYDDVTARNGQPTGTMKSRLSRARSKLRRSVLAENPPSA